MDPAATLTHPLGKLQRPALRCSGAGSGGDGRTNYGAPTPCLFLFTGEGAHSSTTDVAAARLSPSWPALEAALRQCVGLELEAFLREHVGVHTAPHSPLVTTILNIANADRWRAAGHDARLVLGHSIGEVAAAHAAGLLSLEQAVRTAHVLGQTGAQCTGAMLHDTLSRRQVDAWADDEPLLEIDNLSLML